MISISRLLLRSLEIVLPRLCSEGFKYKYFWDPLSSCGRHWRYFFLNRLISKKQDKLWYAAIWQDDGEIAKLLQEFEKISHLDVEGGQRLDIMGVDGGAQTDAEGYDGIDIAIAIAICRNFWFKSYAEAIKEDYIARLIETRMKNTRDQLANTARRLTIKETVHLEAYEYNIVSILWICIHRNHASDVDYLLRNANIDLRFRNGRSQDTVLHEAVSRKSQQCVHSILETNSSLSPLGCLELGDWGLCTPLHTSVMAYFESIQQQNLGESHVMFEIARSLLEHGANANALDDVLKTPLHYLLRFGHCDVGQGIIPLLQELLSKGAEVNSKDWDDRTPLHLACKNQDRQAILLLVKEGADLEALDRDEKTPRNYLKIPDNDKQFSRDLEILAWRGFSKRGKRMKLPQGNRKISKTQMQFSKQSPVYCRLQVKTKVTDKNKDVVLNWAGADHNVSDVLYSNSERRVATFLEGCQTKAESVWEVVRNQLDIEPLSGRWETYKGAEGDYNAWRWVSFPINNMTWIKDFILDHINDLASHDTKTAIWEFFKDNIKVCDTNEIHSRIRAPHAKQMRNHGAKSRSVDSNDISQAEAMVSIVIPFLDIEISPLREAFYARGYFAFTGIDGVQVPQTLDQTFDSSERLSGLRSNKNQVIYRWCVKQASRERGPLSESAEVKETWTYWRSRRHHRTDWDATAFTTPNQVFTDENSGKTAKIQAIQQGNGAKWLMVRQLWLWKLHDGTILTVIPSRAGRCMSDDLLETIRHSELNEISTSDDLIKHIVQQTVAFTERFRLAGLGKHILDIFENELASEIDQEAGFFNSFTRKDWNSKYANKAINEAAGCTWRVKDIRGELRLIDKVFTQQLGVLREFAAIVASTKGLGPEGIKEEEATLIQDSGLEVLRERIRRMDEDAVATIDGLSNITQAMLAQASLKEAESARLMNFIILPFTVVTVIFTPLSFMTSLFAVNSDGFPHNDDGELRIPSDWLRHKMIIGEIGTLIPLLIIVVSISYLRSGTRRTPKEQPKQ